MIAVQETTPLLTMVLEAQQYSLIKFSEVATRWAKTT